MSVQAVAPAKAPTSATTSRGRIAFSVTVFLSAFLLFQIQLIVGKQLLPWFGGSAAVWNTCLVFFQILLLAGYAYSHFIATRLKNAGTFAHLFPLLLSAAALVYLALVWRSPVSPSLAWQPQNPDHPVWDLMKLLAISVGLPFFTLSATAPLLQTWFAHANPTSSPYPLYAVSNLGSLLGLLTYPALFEPNLTLRNQGRLWALIYFLFLGCCTICALRASSSRGSESDAHRTALAVKPSSEQRLLWLGLSACGCIMLLSVTNLICQEIAVVPLLWVLPLALYLLSFVLCFHRYPFYRRGVFHALFALAAAFGGILFLSGENIGAKMQIVGFSLLLFAACMVYHGELARLKPHSQALTSFYMHIAVGGALGSVLIGIVAPLVFPAIWEFQLSLWFSGLVVAFILLKEKTSWFYQHLRWLPLAVLTAVAGVADLIGAAVTIFHVSPIYIHVFTGTLAAATLVAMVMGPSQRARNPKWLWGAALCGWCFLGLLFSVQAYRQKRDAV
ncbi:MAG: hypothetical protein JOZ80_00860, partial [Acidobacteriaceae bacterium]|nr:hypothetical protein [Acidobacteriaceae bacterium]